MGRTLKITTTLDGEVLDCEAHELPSGRTFISQETSMNVEAQADDGTTLAKQRLTVKIEVDPPLPIP